MAARLLVGLLIILCISLLGAGLKQPMQPPPPHGSDMTLPVLQALLREVAQDLKGETGQWRFTMAGGEMVL